MRSRCRETQHAPLHATIPEQPYRPHHQLKVPSGQNEWK